MLATLQHMYVVNAHALPYGKNYSLNVSTQKEKILYKYIIYVYIEISTLAAWGVVTNFKTVHMPPEGCEF